MSSLRDSDLTPEGHGIVAVCQAFGLSFAPQACHFLGSAGGYSGAQLWRVESGVQDWCVRRWPREHPDLTQLRFVHDVIGYVRRSGMDCFSQYRNTAEGTTVFSWKHHLWEVSSWLQGFAIEGSPSQEQLVAAMDTLGRFHRAVVRFASCLTTSGQIGQSRSPGIASRLKMFRRWSTCDLNRFIHNANEVGLDVAIVEMIPLFFAGLERHGGRLRQRLEMAISLEVPCVPCLRDIRREHVLYSGSRVSGIVDYGSLNWENKSADVARLLGSLLGEDRDLWRQGFWEQGLEIFQQHVRLSAVEVELAATFLEANILLSGFQWLEWLVHERRKFESVGLVTLRLRSLLEALRKFPFESR